MPYEELFASGRGFTSPQEASIFVKETGVDWLSVAIGNIHGAISAAAKNQKKVEARLNIEHLQKIKQAVNIPLVLHGGSGIKLEYLRFSFKNGIVKINVGAAIRQKYEQSKENSILKAQDMVYQETMRIITEDFKIKDSVDKLFSNKDRLEVHHTTRCCNDHGKIQPQKIWEKVEF